MALTAPQLTNIAALVHGVQRFSKRLLGDYYDPPWGELETWEQDEFKALVTAVDDATVTTAAELQAWWRASRVAAGWTQANARDLETKTHPDIAHWRRLPWRIQLEWEQKFDVTTQSVVVANA